VKKTISTLFLFCQSQAQEAQFKHPDSSMFENGVRDRWHKKGAADRDGALLMDMEGLVTQKEKIVRVEEAEGNYSDDDDGLGALKTLAEMSASLAPAGLLESG